MIESLDQLYQDKRLYSSADMFSPPAERRPHVIRFEMTTGCPWGKCTYCNGFDGISSAQKDLGEYKRHVRMVFGRMKGYKGLRRVFIGGGDALAVDTATLKEAINYTSWKFLRHIQEEGEGWVGWPSRVAMYGSTRSINKKSIEELKELREWSALGLIYWGVESGSSSLLAYVNKGCSQDDVLEAAGRLSAARFKTSVMIIPGLGGIKYYNDHIEQTAKVLGEIRPKYVTFMGLNAEENCYYSKRMGKEEAGGVNRPLTKRETAEQMLEIIRLTPISVNHSMKVGCFGSDIDKVGCNSFYFGNKDLTASNKMTNYWTLALLLEGATLQS